jgi:5-methylcytosine-specific restriction protein B
LATRLAADQRLAALTDPWRVQAHLDAIEGAEKRQLRHMLLHLLFPDTFERIASGRHKHRICEKFGDLVSPSPEDPDRHLLGVRRALEGLLPRQRLDFYGPPLVSAWYDTAENNDDVAPVDVIRHKKQLVLYGPPGTGKTHRAKQLAEQLIRSAALKQWGAARYFRDQAQLESTIRSHVRRLQLHPAYSYEDFIRALHIQEGGATVYRLGYLPSLIAEIEREPSDQRLPYVLILDEMNRTDLSRMLGECFSLLEDREQTVDLPGLASDGKALMLRIPSDLYVIGTMNLIDQSIEQVDFALRRRFFWVLCGFDPEALLAAAQAKWAAANIGVEWVRVEPEFRQLAAAAARLNRAIDEQPLLGGQYEIGHTYLLDVVAFLKDDLGPRPKTRKFYLWNKGEALSPVVQVWRLSLWPLLREYLAGIEAAERDRVLAELEKTFLAPPETA